MINKDVSIIIIIIIFIIIIIISIIPFKRCPILRTQLWRLLCKCWQEKQIPSIWKRAVTILIHKKGPLDNPSNFRPITLEPVMLKVLTSLLRNRIF